MLSLPPSLLPSAPPLRSSSFSLPQVGLTDFFVTRKVEGAFPGPDAPPTRGPTSPDTSPPLADLYLNQPEWYHAQEEGRFEFHVGQQVTHIDTERKVATTDSGAQYEFDICVVSAVCAPSRASWP